MTNTIKELDEVAEKINHCGSLTCSTCPLDHGIDDTCDLIEIVKKLRKEATRKTNLNKHRRLKKYGTKFLHRNKYILSLC